LLPSFHNLFAIATVNIYAFMSTQVLKESSESNKIKYSPEIHFAPKPKPVIFLKVLQSNTFKKITGLLARNRR
jgi:hypothetical protein